jgi:chaperonin cofactor prefoldin
MTTGPIDIERKVRQLDNDVMSIYDMLVSIQHTQQRHSERFNDVDRRFETLESRIDSLDSKVETLDVKVDKVLDLLGGAR